MERLVGENEQVADQHQAGQRAGARRRLQGGEGRAGKGSWRRPSSLDYLTLFIVPLRRASNACAYDEVDSHVIKHHHSYRKVFSGSLKVSSLGGFLAASSIPAAHLSLSTETAAVVMCAVAYRVEPRSTNTVLGAAASRRRFDNARTAYSVEGSRRQQS